MNVMRGLGGLTRAYLLESWRNKLALFWNLAFPLLTLAGFALLFGGGDPQRVLAVVPGILTINMVSACFFGISLVMVSLRERELYRRLRATPVTALTVVAAHALTALLNLGVSFLLQLALARIAFGVVPQGTWLAVGGAALVSALGLVPLGLLVGSVAADMKSAPAISNVLFFPMMFLSGAAVPLFLLPGWMQKLATLLPATYCVELLQATILRGEPLRQLGLPIALLLATAVIALGANASLFRWESREPVRRGALLGVVAALGGLYLVAFLSGVELAAARDPRPTEPTEAALDAGPSPEPGLPLPPPGRFALVGMTVFDGTGRRIENGSVWVDGEVIVRVSDRELPIPDGFERVDLRGLFLVPGLIDSHVHLGGSPGGSASGAEYRPERILRDLQVYLAMGVTSVLSLTDDVRDLERLRAEVLAGRMRAPRPYFSGPGLTAPAGHPARFFRLVPGLAETMTRQVATPAEARAAVEELAALRVDLVKIFLEAGVADERLPLLSRELLTETVRTARELGRPTTVHVDSDKHAQWAIAAGADGVEHVPPDLSAATAAALARRGMTLTPTLTAYEGVAKALRGEAFDDPTVARWVAPAILASLASPSSWIHELRQRPAIVERYQERTRRAFAAARRAADAGVTLLAGSDAGNPGAFHGLGLLRELELLVEVAGLRPAAALEAATGAAAHRLGSTEIGRVAPGAYADLLVVGADPSQDIRALRDVRAVYLGGRKLDRDALLTTRPGTWMPGRQEAPRQP